MIHLRKDIINVNAANLDVVNIALVFMLTHNNAYQANVARIV